MLITPSFEKSFIVEHFQGNYLKSTNHIQSCSYVRACVRLLFCRLVPCKASIRSGSTMYSYHIHVTSVLQPRSLVLATSFRAHPSVPSFRSRSLLFLLVFIFPPSPIPIFFSHLRLCELARHSQSTCGSRARICAVIVKILFEHERDCCE